MHNPYQREMYEGFTEGHCGALWGTEGQGILRTSSDDRSMRKDQSID